MNIQTSTDPAREAGEHISEMIAEHDGDVVCLLSGGSALDVVEYIDLSKKTDSSECRTTKGTSSCIVGKASLHECRTTGSTSTDIVAIKDCSLSECRTTKGTSSCIVGRASLHECRTIFMMGDERGSRESDVNNSLQLLKRYGEHSVSQSFISSVPEVNETLEAFAARIEKIFLEKISELRNMKIISLLGMGTDGHTAGIFPMSSEASFSEVYRDDQTYVPVRLEGLRIDSRASFTPSWLLGNVDAVVGYVTGESKKTMLESLKNETKPIHERPAELFKLHSNVKLYTGIPL